MARNEVPNAGIPRIAYTYLEVVESLRTTMEHMPDARMLGSKAAASLHDGAIYSVDTLMMLRRMDKHERNGMRPAEALAAALREEKK